MWLACNRNMPDTTADILNGILKKIRKDGTMDRILLNYE